MKSLVDLAGRRWRLWASKQLQRLADSLGEVRSSGGAAPKMGGSYVSNMDSPVWSNIQNSSAQLNADCPIDLPIRRNAVKIDK